MNLKPLLILILVAIVLMQDVEVLKGMIAWFINKDWKKGKYGVILAISLGLVAGLTLQLGVTSAILATIGIEYEFPNYFVYFDIASTCLFLSKGSSAFVDTVEKYLDKRKMFNHLYKQNNEHKAPASINIDKDDDLT